MQEAHGVAIDMVGKLVKVWINELGLGKIGPLWVWGEGGISLNSLWMRKLKGQR